jgi:hypothetical protein
MDLYQATDTSETFAASLHEANTQFIFSRGLREVTSEDIQVTRDLT